MEWQPIETAPKDRAILIGGGTYTVSNGEYEDWDLRGVTIAYWYREQWRGDNSSEDEWFVHQPTHWMPLPSPPNTGEKP